VTAPGPPAAARAPAPRGPALFFGRLATRAGRAVLELVLDAQELFDLVEERDFPEGIGQEVVGSGRERFLLLVCKSPEDAAAVRRMLEERPPNDDARFFDYSISRAGIIVTC